MDRVLRRKKLLWLQLATIELIATAEKCLVLLLRKAHFFFDRIKDPISFEFAALPDFPVQLASVPDLLRSRPDEFILITKFKFR